MSEYDRQKDIEAEGQRALLTSRQPSTRPVRPVDRQDFENLEGVVSDLLHRVHILERAGK